jgi:cell division protein YceG involved in septum cleavage
MKKNRVLKIISVLVLIFLVTGAFVYYHYWLTPQRDVKDEKAITVTAQTILDAYAANEQQANAVYLDKAIEVSGEVTEVSKNEAGKTVLSLKTSDPMAGVRCTLKNGADTIKAGSNVRVKGICTGYLMDVTLIDCYLVQ